MTKNAEQVIIDFHTHAFPDTLAPRAMQHLSEQGNIQPYYDGTVNGLLDSMDDAGLSLSIVQPIATKPSQVVAINDWSIAGNSRRVLFFGTMHPDFADVAGELQRIHDAGIMGIKLHGDYQELFVDDEKRAFPIYERLQLLGMIVLFHAGIDIGIPPPVHASPERIARVHEAFPDLTIIAAHLGGFRQWDEVERHLVGKPIYLDTSYVMEDAAEEEVMRILCDHGEDRILFASDGPWMDMKAQLRWLNELDITDESKQRILHENAQRLLCQHLRPLP